MSDPVSSTHGDILHAARRVIARFTLAKFVMEDVAREAGVARQTVYKHFRSRDDLVTQLLIDETRRVHAAKVLGATEETPTVDGLVRVLIADLQATRDFADRAQMLEPSVVPWMTKLLFNSPALDDALLELWEPILSRYVEASIVRDDLPIQEIVRWVTYQRFWFVVHPDTLCDEATVPNYIRDFLVPALLTAPVLTTMTVDSGDEQAA